MPRNSQVATAVELKPASTTQSYDSTSNDPINKEENNLQIFAKNVRPYWNSNKGEVAIFMGIAIAYGVVNAASIYAAGTDEKAPLPLGVTMWLMLCNGLSNAFYGFLALFVRAVKRKEQQDEKANGILELGESKTDIPNEKYCTLAFIKKLLLFVLVCSLALTYLGIGLKTFFNRVGLNWDTDWHKSFMIPTGLAAGACEVNLVYFYVVNVLCNTGAFKKALGVNRITREINNPCNRLAFYGFCALSFILTAYGVAAVIYASRDSLESLLAQIFTYPQNEPVLPLTIITLASAMYFLLYAPGPLNIARIISTIKTGFSTPLLKPESSSDSDSSSNTPEAQSKAVTLALVFASILFVSVISNTVSNIIFGRFAGNKLNSAIVPESNTSGFDWLAASGIGLATFGFALLNFSQVATLDIYQGKNYAQYFRLNIK